MAFRGRGSSDAQNPFHVYGTPGSYSAQVWVNDSAGVSTKSTVLVSIDTALQVALSVSNATPVLGQSIAIDVNATGGVAPYTYAYVGLPPGCVSVNGSTIGCFPTQAGYYNLTQQSPTKTGYRPTHRPLSRSFSSSPWRSPLEPRLITHSVFLSTFTEATRHSRTAPSACHRMRLHRCSAGSLHSHPSGQLQHLDLSPRSGRAPRHPSGEGGGCQRRILVDLVVPGIAPPPRRADSRPRGDCAGRRRSELGSKEFNQPPVRLVFSLPSLTENGLSLGPRFAQSDATREASDSTRVTKLGGGRGRLPF